jgi:MYXO-CTERM domain-containing protein
MRALVALIAVLSLPASAEACPVYDHTYVAASRPSPRPFWEPLPALKLVASQPRVFVHLGTDSPPGMPTFFALDGSVVASHATPVDDFIQVDLDVDEGMVLVRFAGDRRASEILVVDTGLSGTTRSVNIERRESEAQLSVDSDAVAFRIERFPGEAELWPNVGLVFIDADRYARVTALYSDHREEVIFDYVPSRPGEMPTWLTPGALGLLAAGGLVLLRRRGSDLMTA